MDCTRCTPQQQAQRGCEAAGRVPWGEGSPSYVARRRCPMTILRRDRDQHDPDAALALRLASAYRQHNALAVAGGYLQQPALWEDAVLIVSSVFNELDADAHEKALARARSGGRGQQPRLPSPGTG